MTRGLLELLTPAELEAVVGHELAHVANRDAAVMTAVGGPGAVLLAGASGCCAAAGGSPLRAAWSPRRVGRVSLLGTQVALARSRARGRRRIGRAHRPARGLASALRRISGQLALIPQEDLRVAACRDIFHLLAVEEEGDGWAGRLGATHPPLEQRIARLERMERAHGARRGWRGRGSSPAGEDRYAATSQAFRLGSGSIGRPPVYQPGAGHSSKCRWQAVASPVRPTKPIGWPVVTASPF